MKKMRAISRSEGCGEGCFVSVWSSDKAVVPCLKYDNQLFSHRFTGTRHLGIQLDTMSFTNPEKKGRCGRHKTPEGAQSIRPAFPRCSHRTHPTPLLVNAHWVQKEGDTPSTLRKNDAALVIQRIRAPTQKEVVGGVQIRLRFYLGVAPVDD